MRLIGLGRMEAVYKGVRRVGKREVWWEPAEYREPLPRHPELVEEEREDIGLLRDFFAERRAHAVAGVGAAPTHLEDGCRQKN